MASSLFIYRIIKLTFCCVLFSTSALANQDSIHRSHTIGLSLPHVGDFANYNFDGSMIITANIYGITTWDSKTGAQLHTYSRMFINPDILLHPKANIAYCTLHDSVFVLNTNTCLEITKYKLPRYSHHFILSNNGEHMVAMEKGNRSFCIFNPENGHIIKTIKHNLPEYVFSPNDKYLVSFRKGDTIFFWDTHTWKIHSKVQTPYNIYNDIHISNDNTFLTGSTSRGIVTINIEKGCIESILRPNDKLRKKEGLDIIAITKTGRYVLTNTNSGASILWDTKLGTPIKYLNIEKQFDYKAFNTDNDTVIYIISDKRKQYKLYLTDNFNIQEQTSKIPISIQDLIRYNNSYSQILCIHNYDVLVYDALTFNLLYKIKAADIPGYYDNW